MVSIAGIRKYGAWTILTAMVTYATPILASGAKKLIEQVSANKDDIVIIKLHNNYKDEQMKLLIQGQLRMERKIDSMQNHLMGE